MQLVACALLDVVLAVLRARRFRFTAERQLQDGIERAFREAGLPAERERSLGAAGRIDFLVGDVGVEVKVAGSVEVVTRQLARYAASPDVGALVLVQSRWQGSGVPDEIAGKPVRVHVIARGFGG